MPLAASTGTWSLVLDGIQAVAVFFGVTFGMYQLRDLRRRSVSESLDRMFKEWKASLPAQEWVISSMPIYDGTVETRAILLGRELLAMADDEQARDRCKQLLATATNVVYTLNDIGIMVERKSVNQRDFFGQLHIRILELAYLLEPYVFLISAGRGTRWVLRVGRLRVGAERFHSASRIHRGLQVEMHKTRPDQDEKSNTVVLERQPAGHVPAWLRELRLRRRLIPSQKESAEAEDQLMESLKRALEAGKIGRSMTPSEFLAALPYQV